MDESTFIDNAIKIDFLISSPEPKAHKVSLKGGGRAGVLPSIRPFVPPSVCMCVNTFKDDYLRNQLADCNQIYLKNHWGGGKAALGFWPDQIGTLVKMATDSSHRVIMGKIWLAL